MSQSIAEISNLGNDNIDLDSETTALFENVFDFFGILDRSGHVLWLRGKVFEEVGVNPDLLIDQKFSETVFWQSSENTAGLLEKAIQKAADGEIIKELLNFRLSSDKKIAIEITLQPLNRERPD